MAIALYLLNVKFLENNEIFHQKMKKLNENEQKNILKRKNKDDKIRSLGARLLLQKLLSDRNIEKQELIYGEHGKPYLKYENNIYFNISHSGEYVACAVGVTEMGVDIQIKKDISLKIAEKSFTRQELEKLQNLTIQDDKNHLFFTFWSAKESYVKCTGDGLQRSFNQLEVDLNNMTICDLTNKDNYYLKEYRCLEGYSLFVCSKSNDFGLFVKTIYYNL